MPIALTNPETQETIEAPTFSEWEKTLGRPADAKDVARFAKITTAQMARAGVDGEEDIQGLYNGLYQSAVKRSIVPGQDPENEFKSIFDQDHRDETKDFDLVADQLEADQRIDDATKVRAAAEGLRTGSAPLDLEDVKSSYLTPENLQAARIKYAKDNGLPFIDYKTTDGRTGVYVNPNAPLDRESIFKTAVDKADVVDPSLAKFAYEQTKPEVEGGLPRYKAARIQEAAGLISDLAEKNLDYASLQVALRDASEDAADFAEERDMKGTTGPVVMSPGFYGFGATAPAIQVKPEATVQDIRKASEARVGEILDKVRKANPDSPLFDEYSDDEIKGAFADLIVQQTQTKTDFERPERNFTVLSSGIKVPLSSAAFLSTPEFDAAADKVGLTDAEKTFAQAVKKSVISANIDQIDAALKEFDGDGEGLNNYLYENLDSGKSRTELVSEYLDKIGSEDRSGLAAKVRGFGSSFGRSIADSAGAVMAFLGKTGTKFGPGVTDDFTKSVQEYGEKVLIGGEENERRRNMYLGYIGAPPGVFYEAATQIAPMVVDIALARGAGTAGRAAARLATEAAVGAATKTGAMGFLRNAGTAFIERAMAASPEARTLAQKMFAPTLKKYSLQGAEQSARKIFRAIRRDVINNAGQFGAQRAAQAAQIGSSFSRSAASTWAGTYIDMRAAKNPDGTPKFTEEQIRDTAFTNAMVSGGITAVTELAFGKLLGEGADVTTFERMNVRQLKAYTNSLNAAFAKSGFGGDELYKVLKNIGTDTVRAAYGEAFKQIPAEAAEEFTDEFVQGVALDLLNDEKLDIGTAFKNALKAGFIGGIFGGAIGTPSKIWGFRTSLANDILSGTVQDIQQQTLSKAIASLEATGSTATANVLRERARLAQRRGVSVESLVTPTSMRRYLQDRFDTLPEQPAPEPYVATTPVSLTARARATAKELRVSQDELATIKPSKKDNRLTSSDIIRFANARAKSTTPATLTDRARATAEKLGVSQDELATIQPSGANNTITPSDVTRFANARTKASRLVDATKQVSLTARARATAKKLRVTRAELATIQPSGKDNTITPNDITRFANARAAAARPAATPPPPMTAAPAGDRTFRELEGQIVVINNYGRGRVRIDTDTGDVLLDKEDGTPPLLLTPNADMVAGEFEGFNTVVGQPAAVAPRRGVRRVEPIDFGTFTQDGKIVYGNTEYRLPDDPLYANVVRNDEGVIDSMSVRVYDKDGNSTWVYVDGQDVDLIRQAYEARGDDTLADHDAAVESAIKQDIKRNQAALADKAKKSRKNRAAKRARTGAPVITNSGQTAVEQNPDLRLVDINSPKAPVGLKQLIRDTAIQLGLDPDVITDRAELLEIVGAEIAAGLDFSSVPEQARLYAEIRMDNGFPPKTLLELLVKTELTNNRGLQAVIARNRARNNAQVKAHGFRPGRVADVGALLQNIARTAKSKVHRETAKMILERGVPDSPVFITEMSSNLELAGAYLPNSNAIVLNLVSDNGGGPVDALLHELAHARFDKALTDSTDPVAIATREKLANVRERLVARANELYGNNMRGDLRYALEGRWNRDERFDERVAMKEFVAHFRASTEFRRQIALLDVKGERSFVQVIIDAIADFFGVNRKSETDREVLDLIERIDQSVSDRPYGQSLGSMSASRIAFDKQQPAGPNVGLPNPHPRSSFAWAEFAIDGLANQPVSTEEVKRILQTNEWAMLTGENPDGVVVDEGTNATANEQAKAWLRSNGYTVYDIIGRYEGNGEYSFLVPDMTIEQAVGFANQFRQKEVATADGIVDRNGAYHPYENQNLEQQVTQDDDFFSAIRTSDGTVVPIRVNYKWAVTEQLDLAAETQLPRTTFEDRIGHPVQESTKFTDPVTFDGNTIFRNPAAIAQRYDGFDEQDTAEFTELDSALAVAVFKADNAAAIEDAGYSPEQFVREAISSKLDQAVVRTLAQDSPEVGKFVADVFNTLSVVNDGTNTKVAEAVNALAELARGIAAGNTDVGAEKPFDPANPDQGLAELAARLEDVQPVVSASKISIDPVAVKARVNAGRRVGTRSPTAVGRLGEGVDAANRVDLETMRANSPVAYRRNALLLCEYPIIARRYPKLASVIRKWVADGDKIKEPVKKINASISIRNKSLRVTLADVFKAKSEKEVANSLVDGAALAYAQGEQEGIAAGRKATEGGREALVKFITENQGKATKKLLDKYISTTTQLQKLESRKEAAVATEQTKKNARAAEFKRLADSPNVMTMEIADGIYRTLQADTEANLMALIELFPADVREVAKLWYDGANIIANEFAKRSNVSTEKAAGILAVFSPQKDWFMNVTIAERMMEIYTNEQGYQWDAEMSAQYMARGGEPQQEPDKKTGELKWPKGITPILDSNGNHMVDSNGMLMFNGWSAEKREAARKKAAENLKLVEGKPLSALTLKQQAWFIRMREETKYPGREFRTVSPSGEFGPNKTLDSDPTTPQKMAWGAYDTIEKAITIFNAPAGNEMAVISEQLGDKHKVRSFYNNIVDPASTDGDVTMDTHAIAALLWMPLSGGSREVSQNFGSANTPSDKNTGISGLYAAFAEAYRSAAVRQLAAGQGNTPYLAREVQSVTWEAVRELFPAKWKSKRSNDVAVRAVWDEYEKLGPDADQATVNAALQDAHRKIYRLAHNKDFDEAIRNAGDPMLGLKLPVWVEINKAPLDNNPKISRSILSAPPETRQDASGYVVAKFRAVAKRLGVDLVPNIVGYPARYVVDSKQGSRYIEYNPGTFVGASLEEIDATFREEIIHAANHNALIKRGTDWVEFQSALGKSLTKDERKMVKSIYTSIRNDMDYGAEYFRMAVQKLLYGTVTEAEVRAKSFDKILGLLKDSADFFRTTDRVDQLTRSVFDDTVNLVRKADPKFATGVRTTKTPRGISRSMIQVASQQDAEYLRLAANPEANRAELQRMVDVAAKKAGFTERVKHGSPNRNLTTFDLDLLGQNTKSRGARIGFFVTSRKDIANSDRYVGRVYEGDWPNLKVIKEGRVYDLFVKTQKPYLVQGGDPLEDRLANDLTRVFGGRTPNGQQIRQWLLNNGYDSVRYAGIKMGDYEASESILLNPEQIKSADPVTYDDAGNVIPLSQRFQATSSDIRYSKVAAGEQPSGSQVTRIETGFGASTEFHAIARGEGGDDWSVLLRSVKDRASKIKDTVYGKKFLVIVDDEKKEIGTLPALTNYLQGVGGSGGVRVFTNGNNQVAIDFDWEYSNQLDRDTKDAMRKFLLQTESTIQSPVVIARQPVMQAFRPDAIDRANTGWKSRSVIVEMNIDDFLKYATPLDKEQRREARAAFEQGTKWESIPQLLFSHDEEYGRRVTGHEGRHRALVLKDAGYTTMPVEIRDQYIRWSEQTNPSNFDYAKVFPTTARSEDGTKTLPFPASRNSYNEQADALARLSSPQPMPISRSRVGVVRLTNDQRAESIKLVKRMISFDRGRDDSARPKVFNALVQVTNDDMMAITQKLDKFELSWLLAVDPKSTNKGDALSRVRKRVRAIINKIEEPKKEGARIFLPSDVVREPVDRLAARGISRSRVAGAPQQDAEYLRLAANPEANRDELQRMVDAAAKAAGYKVKAYHGSRVSDITSFDPEKISQQEAGVGFFFTSDRRLAAGYGKDGKVYEVYLKQTNPLITDVEYPSTPANNETVFSATLEGIARTARMSAFESATFKDFVQARGGAPNILSDVGYLNTRLGSFIKSPEFGQLNNFSQAAVTSIYDTLRGGTGGRKAALELIYLLTGRDGLEFNKSGVFTVLRPEQVKSADPVTYDAEGNVIPLSQRFQATSPDIRYSRVVFGSASINPDRSVAATAADLMLTADGKWNDKLLGSRTLAKYFRPGGNIDPRVFQAYQYHRAGMRVAELRVRKLMPLLQRQLRDAPQSVLDDIGLAAGTVEPTVPAAARAAAEKAYDDAVKAANNAYQASAGYTMYKDGLQKIRADFAIHQDKQLYLQQVKGLEVSSKDPARNPDLATRDAAYAAAAAAKTAAIQQARANNLRPLLAAQRAAQIRLEQYSPDLALSIADLRAAVDEMSKQVIDELGPNDPMRLVIDANLNMYLTRAFRIHHDEGYAKQLLNFDDPTFAAERAAARNFFEADWIKTTFKQWRSRAEYEVFTDAELQKLVEAEAKATDQGNNLLLAYIKEHSGTPKVPVPGAERTDLSKFLLKQEVPAELKALLGEYSNPIENLVRSYATVANFAGTQRMLNQFTEAGIKSGWLVPAADVAADAIKYRNYRQLVTTSRTRGGDPLSEYYAPPEVAETFDAMFNREAKKDKKQLFQAIEWGAKTAVGVSMACTTMGSIGFYMRNACSIGIFGAMNGFVPTASNVALAFKALSELYYPGASMTSLSADLVALGVAKNTLETGLIRDVLRGGTESPDALGQRLQSILDDFAQNGNLFRAVKRAAGKVPAGFGALNDMLDSVYKISYWAHEVDVLMKSNKHRSVPLTLDQAKAEAARIVNRTSQGYDRIPPIAGEFLQSPFAVIFNSFFRFTAEMFRVPVEIVHVAFTEVVRSGNPVIQRRGILRALGLTGTMATATFIPEVVKSIFKIGDDEEETIRASLNEYQENSNLVFFRDGDKINVWDLTYLNPFSMVTDKLARVMNLAVTGDASKIPGVIGTMMLDTFLSPQIATDAFMRSMFYNIDETGRQIYLESDSLADKSLKILNYIGGEAYRLRSVAKMYHAIAAYRDGGVVDTGESVTDPIKTLIDEVKPVRPTKLVVDRIAERAFGYVRREQRAGLDQLKATLKSREAKTTDDIEDAYASYEKTLLTTTADFRRYLRGLEKLGLTQSQIDARAKDADISRRKVALARQGLTERPVFSEEVLGDIQRAGGATRLNQLNTVIERRPRYIEVK